VGRYGSPGRVRSSERLYSVIIYPTDVQTPGPELMYTFISHAEKNGMSVLREGASDEEFHATIELRLKGRDDRRFHGIASLLCSDVRRLLAKTRVDGQEVGDRLYCVLDTDIAGRPHHADIFATVPRKRPNKAVRRLQRNRLMELIRGSLERPDAFRGGRLVARQPQTGNTPPTH